MALIKQCISKYLHKDQTAVDWSKVVGKSVVGSTTGQFGFFGDIFEFQVLDFYVGKETTLVQIHDNRERRNLQEKWLEQSNISVVFVYEEEAIKEVKKEEKIDNENWIEKWRKAIEDQKETDKHKKPSIPPWKQPAQPAQPHPYDTDYPWYPTYPYYTPAPYKLDHAPWQPPDYVTCEAKTPDDKLISLPKYQTYDGAFWGLANSDNIKKY